MLAFGRKMGSGAGVSGSGRRERRMELPFCVACLAAGELEHHPAATPWAAPGSISRGRRGVPEDEVHGPAAVLRESWKP